MEQRIGRMTARNLRRDRRVMGTGWKRTYRGYFGNKKNMAVFVRMVLPRIPERKRIEIFYPGSGSGMLGEELVAGLQKQGIHASLWLLDASKEQLGQNTNPKTKKMLGDIATAQPGKRFDMAIMRSTLDYFWTEKNQIAVLKRIRRWLKPGSVFFNQTASFPTTTERDLADRIYKSNDKIGQRHFQCPEDIERIYQQAGFQGIQKIGSAPGLILTEKEHQERYGIGMKEIAQIQAIIRSVPKQLRPHIKTTPAGYRLEFSFPIYAAYP